MGAHMARVRNALIVASLLAVAGCAPNTEEYLEVARAQRRAIQDITGILEQIRDPKDMAAAKEQLDDRFGRLDAIARKAQAMPKPPPEVHELFAKEGATEALQAMQEQVKRVRSLKGGEQFFEQFEGRRSLLP